MILPFSARNLLSCVRQTLVCCRVQQGMSRKRTALVGHARRQTKVCPDIDSRNQTHLLANLNSLCTSLGTQFVEQSTRMGLNGVFADKEFVSNFPVTHSFRNEVENLEFARSHSQFPNLSLV